MGIQRFPVLGAIIPLLIFIILTFTAGQFSTKSRIDPSLEKSSPKIHLKVNIPEGKLYLYFNEKLKNTYPISVGTAAFKTPIGLHEINEIVWNPWWIPPSSWWARKYEPMPPGPENPLGRVKLPFGNGILLHGTTQESLIGQAASHGCIRMYIADVEQLYEYVEERMHFLVGDHIPIMQGDDKQHQRTWCYTLGLSKFGVDELEMFLASGLPDQPAREMLKDMFGKMGASVTMPGFSQDDMTTQSQGDSSEPREVKRADEIFDFNYKPRDIKAHLDSSLPVQGLSQPFLFGSGSLLP